MESRKYCIFHVPNHIDKDARSGSQLRPRKMLEAFQENGYHVDYIMGYGSERKKQIQSIKRKIKAGRKYEFLYSESSTMPTLLTEKNHLPLYPRLDFGFMEYCKKQGIKIGLFYRDIYWKFEKYSPGVSLYKRVIANFMYRYDLRKYKQIVDILYLPSKRMAEQIREYNISPIKSLPPGAIKDECLLKKRKEYFSNRGSGPLKIFYVGGVRGVYDMTELFRALQKRDNVYMTICCRKEEWEQEKDRYKQYLTERVKIVHESGEKLQKYYLEADICSCYFPTTEYRSFAVPIKLFEYVGHVTPVIVTKGTEAGDFIESVDGGFCVEYKESEILKLLDEIYEHQELLVEKHHNLVACLEKNTWSQRACQVEKDLKGEE